MTFLLLSILLWFFSHLATNYDYTIPIPIQYVDNNHHILPDEYNKDTIFVELKTSGYQLLKLKIYNKKLQIPESVINQKKYWLPKQQLSKIEKLIGTNSKIISVKPEKIIFSHRNIIQKLVPIKPNVKVNFEKGFKKKSNFKITPKKIAIYGRKEILQSIDTLETKPYTFSEVKNDLNKNLTLDIPKNVKAMSNSVHFSLNTGQIIERQKAIGIIILDKKDKYILFPDKVKVQYKFFKSDYDNIKDKQITVIFDPNKIKPNDTLAELSVRNIPKGVFDVAIIPNRVSFLVKVKKND